MYKQNKGLPELTCYSGSSPCLLSQYILPGLVGSCFRIRLFVFRLGRPRNYGFCRRLRSGERGGRTEGNIERQINMPTNWRLQGGQKIYTDIIPNSPTLSPRSLSFGWHLDKTKSDFWCQRVVQPITCSQQQSPLREWD